MKVISLTNSEGNEHYGYEFERMSGKTEAIYYHHSDMAPSNFCHDFGIWYLKLLSTDTPALFVDKKYVIQQIF